MTLTCNVGAVDRIARFAIGILLIVLSLAGVIGVWGWIGVVPLATAALSFCPLYTMIGVNTCNKPSA